MKEPQAKATINGGQWHKHLPEADWALYQTVLHAFLDHGLPFAVGGGLAYSTYASRWRYTKDLDLFILPSDRQSLVQLLKSLGFEDYYDQVPYDRAWIFRGYQEGIIVDLIWEMANHHAQVDLLWTQRGREVHLAGMSIRVLPPEELIWTKMYIVQRDRCDWPDLLTILYTQGPNVDWEHLLHRVASDRGLLAGLMAFFSWLCPDRARELPEWIWPKLQLPAPQPDPHGNEQARVMRIDSRDWFYPQSV